MKACYKWTRIKLFFFHCPYYTTIHKTPIYVWKELQNEKPNFAIMLKSNLHKKVLKDDFLGLATDYYLDLLSEYFREFGHAKNFKNILELKLEIIDLKLKFAETGNRFLLNIIELKEDELKKIEIKEDLTDVKKTTFTDEISKVLKSLNFSVDIKKFTIYQYYIQRLSLESNG